MLDPGIRAAGVFVNADLPDILKITEAGTIDLIQLHGQEDNAYIERIREESGLAVWKAFKVRDAAEIYKASHSAADMVLLDNGYGTGAVFDWSVVTEASGTILERGFILAGGLTPDNIPKALVQLSPKIIDISSGVETDKVKDPDKIMEAVRAVRDVSDMKGICQIKTQRF